MRGLVLELALGCCLGVAMSASSQAVTSAGAVQGGRLVEIVGRVTDMTSAPVAGAFVEWGGVYDMPDKRVKAKTDASGRYALRIASYGEGYRLGISARGFAPVWHDYSPPWGYIGHGATRQPPAPPKNTDVVLESAHYVEGMVVDQAGQPIRGAEVIPKTAVEGYYSSFSSPSPPTAIPGCERAHKTDAQGRFRFDNVPPKHLTLNIRADHRHVNDASYDVDTSHTIVMSGSGRPGVLRARVVDGPTSRPVTSFTVAARYEPKQRQIANADGVFEWQGEMTEGSTPGFYIYAKDYLPWAGQLRVMPRDSQGATTIALTAGMPLRGRLLDADTRRPVAGAPVLFGVAGDVRYFEWADWDKYADGYHGFSEVQRAVSDGDGRLWFCEDPARRGVVVVNAPGYERALITPAQRLSPESDGTVPFALRREATIHGSLALEDTSCSVSVGIGRKPAHGEIEWNWERTPVDPVGAFTIRRLPAGEYQLAIVKRESLYRETANTVMSVRLQAGEQKELGLIRIAAPPG